MHSYWFMLQYTFTNRLYLMSLQRRKKKTTINTGQWISHCSVVPWCYTVVSKLCYDLAVGNSIYYPCSYLIPAGSTNAVFAYTTPTLPYLHVLEGNGTVSCSLRNDVWKMTRGNCTWQMRGKFHADYVTSAASALSFQLISIPVCHQLVLQIWHIFILVWENRSNGKKKNLTRIFFFFF